MASENFKKNGTQYINELICRATEDGSRSIVISGNWEIESAVLIPSDFTVILENCHLRMADGTFDNMFRNEHCGDVLSLTPAEGDSNIKLLGSGKAILDGGEYNGLGEHNAGKEGRPNMYVNNLLLFVNVDGFEVRDIHCRNQRWWALNFIYCSNGVLKNLDFLANDTGIDKDGNEYRGLINSKKDEPLVKNADGIDIRHGCHHIEIENITGFTQDDGIAMTGILSARPLPFRTEGKSLDICNIKIKNVRTASYWANVRLLNQGGIPLHDISIEDVYDMSAESEHLDRGVYGVRFGDGYVMYGLRHSTEDETYNVSIRKVRSRAERAAVHLGGKMKNITIEDIEHTENGKVIEDMRT